MGEVGLRTHPPAPPLYVTKELRKEGGENHGRFVAKAMAEKAIEEPQRGVPQIAPGENRSVSELLVTRGVKATAQ
jgi:hypothetical protein